MSRRKFSNVPLIQSGSVTLAAGAGAITNIYADTNTRVFLTRIAAAATADGLSYTVTAGSGNGSIAVDSSAAGDVTTIAWVAVTPGGNPSQG